MNFLNESNPKYGNVTASYDAGTKEVMLSMTHKFIQVHDPEVAIIAYDKQTQQYKAVITMREDISKETDRYIYYAQVLTPNMATINTVGQNMNYPMQIVCTADGWNEQHTEPKPVLDSDIVLAFPEEDYDGIIKNTYLPKLSELKALWGGADNG